MKTVFLLSLLSLLFSIPGLAEVRTIRTSSLFGNKQVVFQGLAAFPDGGRYSYSVESERTQNGDDPATVECVVEIRIPEGRIQLQVDLASRDGDLIDPREPTTKSLDTVISARFPESPGCSGIPTHFSAQNLNSWLIQRNFGDSFGQSQSSLQIAVGARQIFDVELNPASGHATLQRSAPSMVFADAAFYYRDRSDRMRGTGPSLKESREIPLTGN